MNTPNENHEPTTLDDLHDRLVDRALGETLGNDAPPDLSARIMAVVVADRLKKVERRAPTERRARFRWLSLAVAAALLIGTTTLLLSTGSQSHDVAKGQGNIRVSDSLEEALEAQGATPAISPKNEDFDSLVDLIQSTVESDSSSDGVATSPSAPTPGTAENGNVIPAPKGLELVMEQSQSVEGEASAASAAKLSGQLQNNSAAVVPTFTSDLDVPFRYNSFDLAKTEQREEVMRDTSRPQAVELESKLNVNADGLYGMDATTWGHHQSGLALGYAWNKRSHEFDDDIKYRGETSEGTGPGNPGDQYTRIFENPFIVAEGPAAVSTFSIDVDTASYTNVRQFLQQMNQLPPPDAVRIEELINYFDYGYAGPNSEDEAPFAAHVEVAGCPWAPDHRFVRIGIKGREMDRDKRPKSNLVFLVDVSGSMDQPNKLPLVLEGLQMLTKELGENDRVAIVVYASSEGLVLPSTPGSEQQTILDALGRLQAGGSTAGGAGIQLAYQIAEDNFIEGGTNRVILCTDGDFNVGVTSTAELQRLCEQKAKDTRVFLSVLGFGRGNLNDAMMEAISNRGNGNYAYVDNRTEARRVLVNELTGTLVTIAKDVKIQVEFNPAKVAGYRLIGYENRMLRTEDFNDDKKDAGEIGAGHTVTALYEIVPAGKKVDVGPSDDLKYQQPVGRTIVSADEGKAEANDKNEETDRIVRPTDNELLTLKMRYKAPDGDASKKLEWPVTDDGKAFAAASQDFQFATAAAGFGLLLRDSQYKGNLTYGAVLEVAQSALGEDTGGYRAEFVELVRKAKSIRGE
jgi:Ca-activated chloride channel family protein